MTQNSSTERASIPGIARMIAISSGKGGVGKSTLCASLAVAMARVHNRIGLMDTDIYGPNIPGILGARDKPQAQPDSQRIIPVHASGIKLMSMGLLIDPGSPVIWRGPMLAKMISQILFNVEWGELDVLLLDLPPGTGDVQITLTLSAPLDGAVIVTTPSELALSDVRRGVQMFRQSEIPVLGLVENMSGFTCPKCGSKKAIFGSGGGRETAATYAIPFLGEVPIEPHLRLCADSGRHIDDVATDSTAAHAITRIAMELLATGN